MPKRLPRARTLKGDPKLAHYDSGGGAPGEVGRNWVERVDGTREDFGATFKVEMNEGDVFVIQTPGGGGFGTA
jgi:5-oxoprolinase (ATP-hydrolysing)